MFQIQLSAIIAGKDFKRKVSQGSIDEPAAKRRKSAQKSLEFEDYSTTSESESMEWAFNSDSNDSDDESMEWSSDSEED